MALDDCGCGAEDDDGDGDPQQHATQQDETALLSPRPRLDGLQRTQHVTVTENQRDETAASADNYTTKQQRIAVTRTS